MDAHALLPEYVQEMAGARTALSRIPFDRGEFKPHERSWSIRELAAHIANIPSWLTMTLQTDELDLAQPLPSPPLPETVEELLARFDENVARGRAALEAATGPDLMAEWTLRNGDEIVFTLPRIAVVRSMVMNHLIHHRGQLTVYLRMTDAPVPGLYGRSADEMDERADGREKT